MESYTYKWLLAVAEADSLVVACKKMRLVELLVEMHQLCWQGPLANVFFMLFCLSMGFHPSIPMPCLVAWTSSMLTHSNELHPCRLESQSPSNCSVQTHRAFGMEQRGGTAIAVSLSWQPEFRSFDWTFLSLHPLFPPFPSTSVGRQLDLAWF